MNIIDFEIEDIIMIIKNMINLIKTYDNYNFAFIKGILPQNENENEALSVFIKERDSIHIEYSKFTMLIQEPMVINAFEDNYNKMWEGISLVDKNKTEIIKWLEQQVNLLKKQQPLLI